MDYEKIGKFILQLRKEQGLTQSQLAEKLNVTNKAISKWERGLGAPDVSLLSNLSAIFKVSINELLLGEKNELLINDQSGNILIESIISHKKNDSNKTITMFLFIFFMFAFFGCSLIIFNASMIISKFYLYIVFSILGCLFISTLFFIKIINNNQIKRIMILIACIGYTASLLSYTLYTGISYNLDGIKTGGFDVNIIPLKTIITSFDLVISKVQPPSLLFDYVVVDLFLFMPYALFIPYLYGEKLKYKSFLFLFFIIIILKELIQLMTGYGVFNIDDIILNILGLVTMFCFLKEFKFIIG